MSRWRGPAVEFSRAADVALPVFYSTIVRSCPCPRAKRAVQNDATASNPEAKGQTAQSPALALSKALRRAGQRQRSSARARDRVRIEHMHRSAAERIRH